MWVTHYTLRGGASNRGTYCGTLLIDNGDVASYASWTRAAALSLYTLFSS